MHVFVYVYGCTCVYVFMIFRYGEFMRVCSYALVCMRGGITSEPISKNEILYPDGLATSNVEFSIFIGTLIMASSCS